MKPRLNVHLSRDLSDKIDLLARRPGITKASVVEAALMEFFTKQGEDQREGALVRRLDRLTRQFARLERNQTIFLETLALHIRFVFMVSAPIPAMDQDAAKAVGLERFQHFVTELGQRLAAGRSLMGDVLEDMAEGDLLTKRDAGISE